MPIFTGGGSAANAAEPPNDRTRRAASKARSVVIPAPLSGRRQAPVLTVKEFYASIVEAATIEANHAYRLHRRRAGGTVLRDPDEAGESECGDRRARAQSRARHVRLG